MGLLDRAKDIAYGLPRDVIVKGPKTGKKYRMTRNKSGGRIMLDYPSRGARLT